MDRRDARILRELAADGRLSNVELGALPQVRSITTCIVLESPKDERG